MEDLLSSIKSVLDGLEGQSVLVASDDFDDDGLLQFLDAALRLATRSNVRLSGVEIDPVRHPHFADTFWHVPVSASATSNVIRLSFASGQSAS
jgi:hypothetical protein